MGGELRAAREKWGQSQPLSDSAYGTVPIFLRRAFAIVIGGADAERDSLIDSLAGCGFDGVASGEDENTAKQNLRDDYGLDENNDFILILDTDANQITNTRWPDLKANLPEIDRDIYNAIKQYL